MFCTCRGSNARALEKARTLDADTLILDLEDAVAPEAKELARVQVCDAVEAGGYGHREIVIRINGLDTPWGSEDLAAAIEAGPDAILAPKVSSASDIYTLAGRMDHENPDVKLWAMMETPLGVLNAAEIAATASQAGSRLAAFVMGTNDLAKETGARLTNARAGMAAWLSVCVAAARAHGLAILDGVYNDFRDLEGLAAECEQGRDLGMDGKTLIHPGQIEAANRIFAPGEAEVADARAVIAAFELPENAGKGAINLNGRMVERMHAEIAERTVRLAEAIQARGTQS